MTFSEPSTAHPWPVTDDAIREVFAAMLADGSWGRYHGPHGRDLIAALAEYHAVEHVLLCSSGTAAVELALRGAGVTAGDEVILAGYDFKSNFVNVLSLGATPVLVDTLPGAPVMDPLRVSEAITGRTRALICSHLHGSLAPAGQICEVVQSHGIVVIEDACQASGAIVGGRRAGTGGHIGVLSFGGSKLLTAGRGGALLTHDAGIAQRIRLYTQRGNDAYPLSEMQAAVLLPQLRQLDDRNQQRWQNVQLLSDLIRDQQRIVLSLSPGHVAAFADSRNSATSDAYRNEHSSPVSQYLPVFYKLAFMLQCSTQRAESEQAAFVLRQQGLAVDPGFPALHMIHGRSRFRAVGDLANTQQLHHQLLTLHHPLLLGSELEIQQAASVLNHQFGA